MKELRHLAAIVSISFSAKSVVGQTLQVVFGDAAGQVRSDPKADPILVS